MAALLINGQKRSIASQRAPFSTVFSLSPLEEHILKARPGRLSPGSLPHPPRSRAGCWWSKVAVEASGKAAGPACDPALLAARLG